MNMKYDGKDIIWCHWDLVRFLQKKDLTEEKVIGVSEYRETKDGKKVVLDYKIYMKKRGDLYAVDIFTAEENKDEYQFDSFDELKKFVDNLPYEHPEYKERPMELAESEK